MSCTWQVECSMNMRIFYQNKRRKGNNMSFQGLGTVQMAFKCPLIIKTQRMWGDREGGGSTALFQFEGDASRPIMTICVWKSNCCFTASFPSQTYKENGPGLDECSSSVLMFSFQTASISSVTDTQIEVHNSFLTTFLVFEYQMLKYQIPVHAFQTVLPAVKD